MINRQKSLHNKLVNPRANRRLSVLLEESKDLKTIVAVVLHPLILAAQKQVDDISRSEPAARPPGRAQDFSGRDQRGILRQALCFCKADIASLAAFFAL